MQMGKGNIVYHNLRMNLDNEQHRRVHMVLSNLNTDIHKSVNQFLIDAADSYINRLKGSELTNDEKLKTEEYLYITREDLEKIRGEIKDELQREMIIILGSALTGGRVMQLSETRMQKDNAMADHTAESTDADKTTVGLASIWG